MALIDKPDLSDAQVEHLVAQHIITRDEVGMMLPGVNAANIIILVQDKIITISTAREMLGLCWTCKGKSHRRPIFGIYGTL